MLFSAEDGVVQTRTVGKNDVIETAHRISGLGGEYVDGDYVAGHQGGLCPTDQYQRLRRSGFDHPVLDFPVGVLGVEVDQGVRVGPSESGDRCSLQLGNLVLVGG